MVPVNGHDWLACKMQQRGIGFVQRDNAFVELDDPAEAQKLADRFCELSWEHHLQRWARNVNPLLAEPWADALAYYWVIEQAEYATDVLFGARAKLKALYERLVDFALVHFGAEDILTFLGRRLHPRFEGEVLTKLDKKRQPGVRIKHRVKENWLKMYDKFGQLLRIETVINNPREFRVRRCCWRKGRQEVLWCPMNKGIANFRHYQRVAGAANFRYLDALAVVDDPAPAYKQIESLTHSTRVGDRRYAGFNITDRNDIAFFGALLKGEHLLQGFYNQQIRVLLNGPCANAQPRRWQSAAIGRRLKRLHVRGLVAKIPRTRRWRITDRGQTLLGSALRLYHYGLATAA